MKLNVSFVMATISLLALLLLMWGCPPESEPDIPDPPAGAVLEIGTGGGGSHKGVRESDSGDTPTHASTSNSVPMDFVGEPETLSCAGDANKKSWAHFTLDDDYYCLVLEVIDDETDWKLCSVSEDSDGDPCDCDETEVTIVKVEDYLESGANPTGPLSWEDDIPSVFNQIASIESGPNTCEEFNLKVKH